MHHFIDISALTSESLTNILDLAASLKKKRQGWPKAKTDEGAVAKNYVAALVFEQPSTRTRTSFAVALKQLGGTAVTLSAAEMQMGRGETISDTARSLSQYVDIIVFRAKSHHTLVEFAQHATVPVINALSDESHPCQTMADLLTLKEDFGGVAGHQLCWLGDANNVARSLMEAAPLAGFHLTLGCPRDYAPPKALLGEHVRWVENPRDAVLNASAVLTDCWVSMGQDKERVHKAAVLEPYRVTQDLMALAKPEARFMHCLPAHRGEEVAADVIDGAQSLIWRQAENRLHVQKAILRWCLNI